MAPRHRLTDLFDLLGDVTTAADRALQRAAISGPMARLDLEVFLRGINAVKSVSLLLGEAHWEFAAAPVRQLFELVINVEYLNASEDRDSAALRYATYGLLQTALHEHSQLLYDKKTGRDIDDSRLRTIESMLETSFPMFRKVSPKGKVTWPHSWCGKTAQKLAGASKNPLRQDQYDQLFSIWSSQAHGSPAAIVGTLQYLDAAGIVSGDDRRIVETGTMAVTLFIELWQTLPNVPPLAPEDAYEWARRLMVIARDRGAPPPVVRTGSTPGHPSD